MKILVTGVKGQVVTSLVEAAATMDDIELVTVGRPDFDLADTASVRQIILATKPDIVVSAAAYTAVDRAEDERNLAYAINVTGAAAVAEAAAVLRVPIIHLSTDYVFPEPTPILIWRMTRPNRKPCTVIPSCVANARWPVSILAT